MRIDETIPAGMKIKRNLSGRYLLVREADREVKLSINGYEDICLRKNETYDFGEVVHKEIFLSTPDGADNHVLIDANVGLVTPLAALTGSATINTKAVIENGNENQHKPVVNVEPGQQALVAVKNDARLSLRIALLSSAAGHIHLGGDGVTGSSGGVLEPGQIDYMDTRDALYAFNPNDEAVSVYIMELNKL